MSVRRCILCLQSALCCTWHFYYIFDHWISITTGYCTSQPHELTSWIWVVCFDWINNGIYGFCQCSCFAANCPYFLIAESLLIYSNWITLLSGKFEAVWLICVIVLLTSACITYHNSLFFGLTPVMRDWKVLNPCLASKGNPPAMAFISYNLPHNVSNTECSWDIRELHFSCCFMMS